jgi:hypothetical protein
MYINNLITAADVMKVIFCRNVCLKNKSEFEGQCSGIKHMLHLNFNSLKLLKSRASSALTSLKIFQKLTLSLAVSISL